MVYWVPVLVTSVVYVDLVCACSGCKQTVLYIVCLTLTCCTCLYIIMVRVGVLMYVVHVLLYW